MRGALGLTILAFVLTSVACGGNGPLSTVDTGGGGGAHPAAGSTGQGGTASTMSGVAGATLTGIAGVSGAGQGVAGMAGTSPIAPTGQGGSSGGPGIVMCGAPTLPNGSCVHGAYESNGVCQCQYYGNPMIAAPPGVGAPCVCPGVGCVYPATDPDNCGACAVACSETSTCNGGTCGPDATKLASAITGCNAMTMVATDALYFADAVNGTINKLGATAPLATGEIGATFLQANGTSLYWYSPAMKAIRSISAAGGSPTTVFTSMATGVDGGMPPDVAGFVVSPDGVTIYISLGNQVLSAPVAGGPSIVVVNEVEGYPGALALDGATYIVYPVLLSNGVVDAALLGTMPAVCSGGHAMTSATCTPLGPAYNVSPNFMAVIAGRAYWIQENWVNSELIGPPSTHFDVIASAQTTHISAAAAAADAIYFADVDPNDLMHGYIEKTPLAPNSTATLLARGQNSPIAIAVDATKVYWANADCAIMSQNR